MLKKEEERACMEYSLRKLMDECNSRSQSLHLALLDEAFSNIVRAEELAKDTIRGKQNKKKTETIKSRSTKRGARVMAPKNTRLMSRHVQRLGVLLPIVKIVFPSAFSFSEEHNSSTY
jgi:hypothetical protein